MGSAIEVISSPHFHYLLQCIQMHAQVVVRVTSTCTYWGLSSAAVAPSCCAAGCCCSCCWSAGGGLTPCPAPPLLRAALFSTAEEDLESPLCCCAAAGLVGAGGAAGAAPAPPVDTGCFVVSLDSAGTGMMTISMPLVGGSNWEILAVFVWWWWGKYCDRHYVFAGVTRRVKKWRPFGSRLSCCDDRAKND